MKKQIMIFILLISFSAIASQTGEVAGTDRQGPDCEGRVADGTSVKSGDSSTPAEGSGGSSTATGL
jgi:hypothetical protein